MSARNPKGDTQSLWALNLGLNSKVISVSADMVPRDSAYVAIRLMRARPAPEILVQMALRTHSHETVHACYSDKKVFAINTVNY